MKSKFATPLLLSSALSLSALSFVACGGDDGNDFPSQPTSSSSFVPEELPPVTPTSSIEFKNLTSSLSLDRVKFKGNISIQYDDSTNLADINAVHFTDVQFAIMNQTKTAGGPVVVSEPKDFVNTFVTTVSIADMGVLTNLLDPAYTTCEQFFLYITATVDDGTIKSVSRDSIPFVRDAEYCKEPEISSSSAVVPGAPIAATTMTVSTKANNCLVFATGLTGETGDVCFNKGGNGAIQLSSPNGLKFAVYDNPNDANRDNDFCKSWLPEQYTYEDGTPVPITTDSFMYNEAALQEIYPDFLSEGDVFFVAIAPTFVQGSAAGFYAFLVQLAETSDANGNKDLTLLVYKGAQ